MDRIKNTFLHLSGQPALVSYITAGSPDLQTTLALMHQLAESGTDIIELGIPFSDPMADGPVIQAAVEQALAQGVTLNDVLALVAAFRQRNQSTAIVLMGYLNPIYRMGYDQFAMQAAQAGVDGVLAVDCPAENIDELHTALKQHNIDCIFLVAPTTTVERIHMIAQKASGFIYYVSLKGVTGAASLDVDAVANKLLELRKYISIPIGVGFGIRDAQSAKSVGSVADAVIVGSRLVQEILDHPGQEIKYAAQLIRELKESIIRD